MTNKEFNAWKAQVELTTDVTELNRIRDCFRGASKEARRKIKYLTRKRRQQLSPPSGKFIWNEVGGFTKKKLVGLKNMIDKLPLKVDRVFMNEHDRDDLLKWIEEGKKYGSQRHGGMASTNRSTDQCP
jgi:hypothetical protein